MTTFHMETDTVHSMANQIKQTVEALRSQAQALQGSVQSVDWAGPNRDEFVMEAEALVRQLEAQAELGITLAGRVDGETSEWEQAAASLSGMSGSGTTFSGGGNWRHDMEWTMPMPYYPPLKLFGAIMIAPIVGVLPGWLSGLFGNFFPPSAPAPLPPGVIPPLEDGPDTSPPVETPLGKLIHDPPATPAVQPEHPAPVVPSVPTRTGYDTFYDIPPQSQGTAYGSAACLPTSLSMLTKYYHGQDPVNKAVEPGDLIKMLDEGDGTSGSGIGLDKLNDDLNEIGYKVTRNFQSDMTGLKDELKTGPLVVNVKVGLTSSPERALLEGNAYNHSVLVKGVSGANVLINDPWSGKEMEIPSDQFERMWSNGGHWAQVVRP